MNIASTIEGPQATFELQGSLTVQTSPSLKASIDQTPIDVCDFAIDLAGVDYVSSAGLRVLVATDKLARRRGGSLRLLHPARNVREVFEIIGLANEITVET